MNNEIWIKYTMPVISCGNNIACFFNIADIFKFCWQVYIYATVFMTSITAFHSFIRGRIQQRFPLVQSTFSGDRFLRASEIRLIQPPLMILCHSSSFVINRLFGFDVWCLGIWRADGNQEAALRLSSEVLPCQFPIFVFFSDDLSFAPL